MEIKKWIRKILGEEVIIFSWGGVYIYIKEISFKKFMNVDRKLI